MNNLQIVEGQFSDIQLCREPETVLAEAAKAAKALTTVLAGKSKKVMMNGEQYLEFEDWQTVARFYGLTAKVVSTTFIDYGTAQGFEAKAVVVRSDGVEISGAEAMCLNDEEKWSARTKYETLYVLKDGSKQAEEPPRDQMVWVDNPNKPGGKIPKKERIASGTVNVPMFQLRSMAQTRACAKALRNVLAWVVVLAGYRPTPAEELDGMTTTEDNGNAGNGGSKAPLKEPQKKQAKQPEGEIHTERVRITSVESKNGEKNGKTYTIYTIIDENGEKYGTFDANIAAFAEKLAGGFGLAKIDYQDGKFGRRIESLIIEESTGTEG